jgi:7-cyano-7-deazaguanine synthase in queuosine biosynthesis
VSRTEAWFRRPFALALAATIAAVAIVPAVVFDYQRREARGLKAEQDLMMALAITRTQLQMARAKAQHRQGTTQ